MTSDTTAAPTGALARSRARRLARRRTSTGPSPLQILVWIGLTVGAYLLLLRVSHAIVPGNSDGATAVLQGQAIDHGNVLLSGWALSYDSFWTVDALINAPFVAIYGVSRHLLNIVPAFVAAAVVLVGMIMARDGRRGLSGVLGGILVFALLALPTPSFALFFVQGPLHVATTLWCLFAFAGLRRGRYGVGWAVAVLFLTLGLLGDLQTALLGVGPAFLAGLFAAARERRWRSGAPLVYAAVAASLLALAVHFLARALGGFTIGPANPHASLSQMVTNIGHIGSFAMRMAGLGKGRAAVVPGALEDVRVLTLVAIGVATLIALVLLVSGLIRGSRPTESGTPSWRLDDLLLCGIAGSLVVFVFLALGTTVLYSRYITAVFIYGSILAGRFVARLLSQSRGTGLVGLTARIAVVACVLGLTGLYGDAYAIRATHHDVGNEEELVAKFLVNHGFRQGIGDYWTSSILTVLSADKVRVRPVIEYNYEPIGRYNKQSDASWYRGQHFQFLAFNALNPFGQVDRLTATENFGRPAHVYVIGYYDVLVWTHPLEISAKPAVQPGR